MNAQLDLPPPRLRPLQVADLDRVLAIEVRVYSFPWTRGNFVDSLAAGYVAELLVGSDDEIIGYIVAMPGVDEMHLLNITVAPAWQRMGYASMLLDRLEQHCREQQAPPAVAGSAWQQRTCAPCLPPPRLCRGRPAPQLLPGGPRHA